MMENMSEISWPVFLPLVLVKMPRPAGATCDSPG